MMERSLGKLGYRTTSVGDGLQAVRLLSQSPCPYDVVLMDLRMPVMDGLTATQLCREQPHLQRLPILVISAESGEQVRMDALKAGANRFLSKPLGPEEIVRCIREIVSQ
jgi:CheY-like chemotaxis protein